MKPHSSFFRKRFLAGTATLALLSSLGLGTLRADPEPPAPVAFTFTGGNGPRLSITFDSPLIFQLTSNVTEQHAQQQILIFSGIHNGPSSGDPRGLRSQLLYTLNGEADPMAAIPDETFFTDVDETQNDTTPADFRIQFTFGGRNSEVGDEYVFASGQTISPRFGWASDPTSYASHFSVFIVNENHVRISNIVSAINTSAIPEPATTAALIGLSAGAIVFVARRRNLHPQTET